MANLEQVLKIAIEEADWDILCGLYTNLTGEEISPPATIEQPQTKVADFDIASLRGKQPTQEPVPQISPPLDYEPFEEEAPAESEYAEGDIVLWQSPSAKKVGEFVVEEIKIDDNGAEILSIRRAKGNKKLYEVHVDVVQKKIPEIEPQYEAEAEPAAPPKHDFLTTTKSGAEEERVYNEELGYQARKIPMTKQHSNSWVDTKTESLVDEDGKSLLVSENPDAGVKPTSRPNKRPPLKKAHVQCINCDRWFDVHPTYAQGYRYDKPGTPLEDRNNVWRCDECNTKTSQIRDLRQERIDGIEGRRR